MHLAGTWQGYSAIMLSTLFGASIAGLLRRTGGDRLQ